MMRHVPRALAALTVCLLFAAGAVKPADAASILLYDDNTSQQNTQVVLTGLGLPHTVANASNFNTLLTGSSWDLVILDLPSTQPAGGYANLINYIAGGGGAIMSYWTLQTEPALAAAFGVSVASSFSSPQDVYAWGAHPIFSGVGPLVSWTDQWADDGDRLNSAGATLLGGFTPLAAGGEGAIALGNGGRTIYNGFLFDEITDANGRTLIGNEIQFVLGQQVPEPGTLLLFGAGAALMAARRRARAR